MNHGDGELPGTCRDERDANDAGGMLEFVLQHRNEILEIASRRGASDVRVFGSVARGDSTGRSDVDFLVRFAATTTLWDRGGMWSDLHDLLGCDIDLVDEVSLRDEVRDDVLRDAVVI